MALQYLCNRSTAGLPPLLLVYVEINARFGIEIRFCMTFLLLVSAGPSRCGAINAISTFGPHGGRDHQNDVLAGFSAHVNGPR